ncbi:MAG: glycosyltransferase family 39 protein [Anaerolineaceae bacterium]|nr:glycosyltransferase family 39 protein [Anaerolineaceae bacterium]
MLRLLSAAAMLLLAGALRIHQIDSQSLWFDEGWSAWAAIQPSLTEALLADTTNPPLYYLLLNVSARLLGDSEFTLRLPSLWLVLITIALTCCVARRIFGRRSAWLALWLAACSAPLWWAVQ